MYRPGQAPLVLAVKPLAVQSSIGMVPKRLPDAWRTYSAVLMDRGSPLQSPPRRITAQSPGILVVDDEAAVRLVVGRVLTSRGYLVLPATNGAEALAVFNAARPSLALLDMRMPVMDGWGFIQALRERDMSLPVLVMTSAEEGQRWANEIGAAGFVSKPFDFQDLVAKVRDLVPPC